MARIEESIEVNVPVSVAYNQLTQFEEFPRFMEGVHTVRQLDDAHLHWHAKRNGKEMEWDSEITRQIPDLCIAWRNTSGPKNEGEVTLHAVEPDRTRITLVMDADDEMLKHHDPNEAGHWQPDQDLMRFKNMMESSGQASGAWRGEIRDGQRVDGKEAESAPVGGSVVGQTADQVLDAIEQTQHQVVKLEQGQIQLLRQPWAMQPWLPGLFRAWEAQFSLLHRWGEEMERILDHWLARAGGRTGQTMIGHALGRVSEWAPPVEVSEQENRLIISADLPGIHKEDVQVEIVDDCLTIEGERREETRQQNPEWRHTECNYGHFYRAIPLPAGIDADGASAAMHDGVLEITVPLQAGTRTAHRLEVQQAAQ
jgi:HSP20 family molecular chaperone IbpA